MTEVYLITGFLGAGKTCFVKNMVKALPHDCLLYTSDAADE